jgi:hypothetical protein
MRKYYGGFAVNTELEAEELLHDLQQEGDRVPDGLRIAIDEDGKYRIAYPE